MLVQEVFDDGDSRYEVTIAADERCCEFAVVDTSGEALIAPGGAQMNVPASWEDRSHATVEQIARDSPRLSAGVGRGSLRYQEVMLRPEAWVAVLGAGRVDVRGGETIGAPDRASPCRLVFANTPAHPLVVSSAFDDWIDDGH
jgi:hypothetical protein